MTTTPEDFEKFLVTEYFKHGSINKVYSAHRFNLPISFAGYHRLLIKFGIIKSAGPNSHLSESLHILAKISTYKIPLERVYHRFTPHPIKVSINTLHRILHYTRLGLTRRQGTALLVTSPGKSNQFLTGTESSAPLSSTGRRGDLAIPMGHSKTGENPRDSIVRVLQQEVFTDLVINSSFPWDALPSHPKPQFFINIADIRVAVYHLELPTIFQFSSFKLNQLKYRNLDEMSKLSVRPGVLEICQKYQKLQGEPEKVDVPEFNSMLNMSLFSLAKAKNT